MIKRVIRTIVIALALLGGAIGFTQIQPAQATAPVATTIGHTTHPTALEPWI